MSLLYCYSLKLGMMSCSFVLFFDLLHPFCSSPMPLPLAAAKVFSPKESLVFCPHEFRLSMLNFFYNYSLLCIAYHVSVLSRLVMTDSLGPHRL